MPVVSYWPGQYNGSGSPSGDPLDLTTPTDVAAALAAGGIVLTAAQSAALPLLVTAASREIQKELHRIIPAADYDEILTPTQGRPDRGIPATVNLSRYPVNTTDNLRVSAGRTTALTIRNTDASANQVARVAFTTTGDPDLQLAYTGLQFTTVASGVATRTPIAWPTTAPYTTLSALAAAVNALGRGWSASVTGGSAPAFGSWPTTELVGAREPKGAFGAGVGLDVFATDLQGYSIDRASGLVSVGYAAAGGGWPGGGSGGYPGSSWGDCDDETAAFGDQIRVTYNAGYTPVPAVYQVFAAEVVKVMLERLKTDTMLSGETAKDYSYTARAVLATSALSSILTSLQKYKDWSL